MPTKLKEHAEIIDGTAKTYYSYTVPYDVPYMVEGDNNVYVRIDLPDGRYIHYNLTTMCRVVHAHNPDTPVKILSLLQAARYGLV